MDKELKLVYSNQDEKNLHAPFIRKFSDLINHKSGWTLKSMIRIEDGKYQLKILCPEREEYEIIVGDVEGNGFEVEASFKDHVDQEQLFRFLTSTSISYEGRTLN